MKNKEILDSWKAISAYLERDIKTCYRWEKELGLPVHRIDDTSSRSKVFAYTSEIDQWLKEKAADKNIEKSSIARKRKRIFLMTAGVVILSAVVVAGILNFRNLFFPQSDKSVETSSFPQAFEEIGRRDSLNFYSSFDRDSLLERLNNSKKDPWPLYYQGKYFLGQNTEETNEMAVILFLQVLTMDETNFVASLGLAQCYVNYVDFAWKFDRKWLDKARDIIRLADVEIKSENQPEYYAALAQIDLLEYVHFENTSLASSLKWIQKGLKKFPDHPQLNSIAGDYYYLTYGQEGKETDFDLALKFKEKAFWLDPYSLNNVDYAELLMLKERFQDAIEVCSQIQNIDRTLKAKFRLGEIFYYSGELVRSQSIFDQFTTPLKLKIDSLLYKGMIASQSGEEDTVKSLIREIKLLSIEDNPSSSHSLKLSSLYFGLGQKDLGFQHLTFIFQDSSQRKNLYILLKYIYLDRNFRKYKETDTFLTLIQPDLK